MTKKIDKKSSKALIYILPIPVQKFKCFVKREKITPFFNGVTHFRITREGW